MKLLIVGLGSMGKRRARLAKGIDASIELCGVDLSEERRTGEEVRRLGIDAYPDIPSAVAARHPDAALVCTAPITHSGIIGQLLDEGLPVFTELQKLGGLTDRQIYNTFNMGIGMVFAVDASEADAVIAALAACGESAYRIGEVVRTSEDGERLVLR